MIPKNGGFVEVKCSDSPETNRERTPWRPDNDFDCNLNQSLTWLSEYVQKKKACFSGTKPQWTTGITRKMIDR